MAAIKRCLIWYLLSKTLNICALVKKILGYLNFVIKFAHENERYFSVAKCLKRSVGVGFKGFVVVFCIFVFLYLSEV